MVRQHGNASREDARPFAAFGEVLAGLFLAAAVTVHLEKGFFILDEGWEYVFILDGFVGLTIAGGGELVARRLLSVFCRPPKADTGSDD
jgi:uncharacterized membrane protein YphA (DoxX/SURF4 family)